MWLTTVGAAALAAALMQVPVSEDVVLETGRGVLHGTLQLPAAGAGTVPVVLIISGSGPTDRDGNSLMLPGRNDSLKQLAEALAEQGIASLRYDKRGIGASAAAGQGRSESDLRFTDFVDDAEGWIAQLRADRRFSAVMIAGHSEGSFIGILAARRVPVDGLISLAGAGRPIGDVLRDQLARAVSPELQAVAGTILDELEAGRRVDEVPQALMVVFRPSVQPYMISWLAYDPAEELGRLTIPLLIVQGSTDLHTDGTDAGRLHAANPRAALLLIEGMNHILKEIDEPAGAVPPSYTDPTLPLHPRLVAGVVEFVKTNCCR